MHQAVARFFAAVEELDIEAVLGCLSEDVRYQNVPHPPALGHAGVRSVLGPFLARSTRVRWDVVASAESGDITFVERVDRFWMEGHEYAIECNGVFQVVGDRIVRVRDYVDLGVWHERLRGVQASRR